MLKVGIVGVSGYSGAEALKILLKHPGVRVTYVSAGTTEGSVDEIWPQFSKQTDLVCKNFNLKDAVASCELIFLAVPHTVSLSMTPQLLNNGVKVIDLSGDYRLKNPKTYEQWYGQAHTDPKNLKQAVYGLPEIYRETIKKASFVSNPGCYATASTLGALPMASLFPKAIERIVIDAKSGVSGAGKKAKLDLIFCEVNETLKAYKVLNHQHSPEIRQTLNHVSEGNIPLHFVPHLLPVNRGLLATIYIHLKEKMSLTKIHSVYKKFYKTEPFVRVRDIGVQPELQHVNHTNFCDIGLVVSVDGKLLVATSVIDNLVKGAAGQAVQNMNIMCGFKEEAGLL